VVGSHDSIVICDRPTTALTEEMNIMRIEKNSNSVALRNRRGTWVLFMRGQRSAGRRIAGSVFAATEWHNHNGVRYFNLTVGNPKVHAKWAFSLWIYFTLGRRTA
jgi:hypothetical protein